MNQNHDQADQKATMLKGMDRFRLDVHFRILAIIGVLVIISISALGVWEYREGRRLEVLIDAFIATAIFLAVVDGWRGGSLERIGYFVAICTSITILLVAWVNPLTGPIWLPVAVMANGMLIARRRRAMLLSVLTVAGVGLILGQTLPAEQMYSIWIAGLLTALLTYAFALRRDDYTAQLRMLALRDALTGAYNRRALDYAFQLADSAGEIERQRHGVAMLDLDHFKRINDEFGHDKGDEVLRALGALVQRHLRSSDRLYRYGGEEFVVLMPGLSGDVMRERMEQLRRHIEHELHLDAALPMPVTVSIGAAGWPGGRAAGEALAAADRALYRAKREGRNRVVMEED